MALTMSLSFSETFHGSPVPSLKIEVSAFMDAFSLIAPHFLAVGPSMDSALPHFPKCPAWLPLCHLSHSSQPGALMGPKLLVFYPS